MGYRIYRPREGDLKPLQHVGSLGPDASLSAALYVAEAAIDGGWADEVGDVLAMLGLVPG